MSIPMEFYLVVSTIMFFTGVYGFITRHNMLAILMSLELILNAVNVNFVVFNRFLFPGQMEGMFFSIFSIGVAAAETAVAIAIIINVFRNMKKIDTSEVKNMKY
ncbi:MAG: NADH-quinone oxidoreductase subunit NuoK [Paludibacteraceae bacterium]|nr:NADH-quinone oxidoreductase subunit NuoK [Paludibacteraceae bacterium]